MLSSPHGLRTKLGQRKSYLVLIELPLLSNFVTSRHLFGSKEAGVAKRRRAVAGQIALLPLFEARR